MSKSSLLFVFAAALGSCRGAANVDAGESSEVGEADRIESTMLTSVAPSVEARPPTRREPSRTPANATARPSADEATGVFLCCASAADGERVCVLGATDCHHTIELCTSPQLALEISLERAYCND